MAAPLLEEVFNEYVPLPGGSHADGWRDQTLTDKGLPAGGHPPLVQRLSRGASVPVHNDPLSILLGARPAPVRMSADLASVMGGGPAMSNGKPCRGMKGKRRRRRRPKPSTPLVKAQLSLRPRVEDRLLNDLLSPTRMGYSAQTTSKGTVKAVGTGEHKGKTLYGDEAKRALEGKQGGGSTDAPHHKGPPGEPPTTDLRELLKKIPPEWVKPGTKPRVVPTTPAAVPKPPVPPARGGKSLDRAMEMLGRGRGSDTSLGGHHKHDTGPVMKEKSLREEFLGQFMAPAEIQRLDKELDVNKAKAKTAPEKTKWGQAKKALGWVKTQAIKHGPKVVEMAIVQLAANAGDGLAGQMMATLTDDQGLKTMRMAAQVVAVATPYVKQGLKTLWGMAKARFGKKSAAAKPAPKALPAPAAPTKKFSPKDFLSDRHTLSLRGSQLAMQRRLMVDDLLSMTAPGFVR